MAKTSSASGLERYKAKRNFAITPEPAEGGQSKAGALQFVIQKHWASRLHYDFRLELEGTMKSWAVPKGPSYDPKDKRMAVHVEDHPISYNTFEGQIPEKQYGAGKVIIWDKGYWIPLEDPVKGYKAGKLKFEMRGHKMHGHWALVRIRSRTDKQDAWLLIKEHDSLIKPASEFSLVDELPDSVASLPMPDLPGASKKTARKTAAAKKSTAVSKNAMPADAVKASMPDKLAPVLATLVDGPPANAEDWIFEIKFDGYRMLTRIDKSGVKLFTRNGHDWTSKVQHLADAIASMKLNPGWLDGEIVVLGENGGTDFQALQNAFQRGRTSSIVYFFFDIPFYGGYDLRGVPLMERRELLEDLLNEAPEGIRFSETFDAAPRDIVHSACKLGLEGVIGKKKESLYGSGSRSPDWIKLKCTQRQEFVIGGYTDPKGGRVGMGSILVGVHNEAGELVYAGSVGSGFTDKSLAATLEQLQALSAKKSPFSKPTENDRRAHWVEPKLLAEVSFSEWTKDHHIRHPVFHGLRSDKPAKKIIREEPTHMTGPDVEEKSRIPAKLKISNPERVIDPSTGITKVEVVRFYALVADLMMEHLKGRPVSLVRAPSGIKGQLFFQKHLESYQMAGIEQLDPAIHPGHDQYIAVAKPEGLLSAAQMNVIEFHTWNAVKSSIAKPDRMTFDMDPGEGVEWKTMQQATELVRVFLKELGLVSFVKTSGGKGMHVVVPLKRQYGWDTVKDFSEAIVIHLARTLPQLFVAKLGPKNRVGKIFIDYLRNGFGSTTATAWSARARPGLGVSVPITWEEVQTITSGAHWHLKNIHTRLDKGNLPWADYSKSAQALGTAMKKLGFKPVSA